MLSGQFFGLLIGQVRVQVDDVMFRSVIEDGYSVAAGVSSSASSVVSAAVVSASSVGVSPVAGSAAASVVSCGVIAVAESMIS
ncbi:MAG: hypothetical protein ACYSOZ_07620, partial [Planctomycetota bacterium]